MWKDETTRINGLLYNTINCCKIQRRDNSVCVGDIYEIGLGDSIDRPFFSGRVDVVGFLASDAVHYAEVISMNGFHDTFVVPLEKLKLPICRAASEEEVAVPVYSDLFPKEAVARLKKESRARKQVIYGGKEFLTRLEEIPLTTPPDESTETDDRIDIAKKTNTYSFKYTL